MMFFSRMSKRGAVLPLSYGKQVAKDPLKALLLLSLASIGFKVQANLVVLHPNQPSNKYYKAVFELSESAKPKLKFPVIGKVFDEDGNPVAGLTVTEKGTSNATTTDGDGFFKINVTNQKALIVISGVGYKSVELMANSGRVSDVVILRSQSDLAEVVVTAYGKVKKASLTDAVQTISGQQLADRPIRTVTDGLVGLAPGLNIRMPSGAPEANPSINLRGFTSLNTNGSANASGPLVLVDGVERPIQDVNPNDVESISFLKDGASSVVYGSRAPYGVVLITTKSGKEGKATFNYSFNTKVGQMALAPT